MLLHTKALLGQDAKKRHYWFVSKKVGWGKTSMIKELKEKYFCMDGSYNNDWHGYHGKVQFVIFD